MRRITVTINGTDKNPWAKMGLRANPFPQIADARPRGEAANAVLRALDSDPIPDVSDLIQRLEGCTPEFIQGCVERYRPGERVKFTVSWPGLEDEFPS